MTAHFNRLSPAADEALTILAEECAEVIRAIAKIQRHGIESHYPADGPSNAVKLATELGQVLAAKELVCRNVEAYDRVQRVENVAYEEKFKEYPRWLHHAKVTL